MMRKLLFDLKIISFSCLFIVRKKNRSIRNMRLFATVHEEKVDCIHLYLCVNITVDGQKNYLARLAKRTTQQFNIKDYTETE